jgi:hypothetical protein
MKRFITAVALATASASLVAAPIGVDGVIGAEWAGATPVLVGYDAAAATSNFGTPGANNHITGYEIYMRRDGQYLYAAVRTTGPGDSGGLNFSNLYFSLRYGPGTYGNNGSSIGFEVTNDRAFRPGLAGYHNDTAANLIQSASFAGAASDPDVIETAIDLSVFTDNALGVTSYGLPVGETAVGIRLNLSQSFGYSVVGGQANFGDARLGFVDLPAATVPAPGVPALAGAALLALAALRRRVGKAALAAH